MYRQPLSMVEWGAGVVKQPGREFCGRGFRDAMSGGAVSRHVIPRDHWSRLYNYPLTTVMGQPTPHPPALLILAAFSRHDEALRWARHRAAGAWGEIVLESPVFDFHQTDYYEPTMGPGLRKVFWGFWELLDPTELVAVKLQTNRWEGQYAALGKHAEPRPLNLDPGYLTLGKLVLASTKDFAHRLYLDQGIYAEITLWWRHGRWQHHAWTFADYRRADYQAFFAQAREYLHGRLRQEGAK